MKKILLSLVSAATLSISSFGQAPEGFKYQAVVRDAGNLILNNQTVGMRLTIQQGSMGGVTAYSETFSVTSNAYGLVNLEIGTGTTSYDFTTIDWGNGPYFIETAADVTGGTSYTVMGTSQLMSVPYALYAKTSGNGSGPQGPAGNDGIDGVDGAIGATGPQGAIGNDGAVGSQGATGPQGAIGNDGAVGAAGPQGATGPQGPVGNDGAAGPAGADGQGGVTQAGTNVTITGTGTGLDPYVVNATDNVDDLDNDPTNEIELPSGGQEGQILTIIGGVPTWVNSPCIVKVGDTYAGGVVFYVDGTGCRGLVAAPSDQSPSAVWGCSGTLIGANGTAMGTGNQNTIDIEAGCSTPGTAADICANLSLAGYTDWFLPSKDELNLMYENIGQGNVLGLGNVGGFASYYWSSTENDLDYAWRQVFGSGSQYYTGKDNDYNVRAVRAF